MCVHISTAIIKICYATQFMAFCSIFLNLRMIDYPEEKSASRSKEAGHKVDPRNPFLERPILY